MSKRLQHVIIVVDHIHIKVKVQHVILVVNLIIFQMFVDPRIRINQNPTKEIKNLVRKSIKYIQNL
jgi:hypothetical protein